jgi:hypothetical protein
LTEWVVSLSPEAQITGDYARHYFKDESGISSDEA